MRYIAIILATCFFSSPIFFSSLAWAAADLKVKAENLTENGKIKADYAYCAPAAEKPKAEKHVEDGKNKRPALSWSAGPKETLSYAVVVVDSEVPTDFSDANQENKTIPAAQKRQDFYHWLQVDIPASVTMLPEGAGRGALKTPLKVGVAGVNDYPVFMKKPAAEFIGYDGPCPPWNDEKIHKYHFKVYALNTASLGLKEGFSWKEAMKLIAKHTVAMGEFVADYSLLK